MLTKEEVSISSMDCTHVLRHRCPKVNCTGKFISYHIYLTFLTINYFNKGKECKPTIAFQVVASHSKKFMHVSEHFYGTWNDKQITVNDTFPVDVWHGDRFKLKRFILINKHGVAIEYQGVWLAVDGGYQKIACFIDPMHNRQSFIEVAFSEWLESVRKDVECAFGILKIRLRFLRGFVIYHDPLIIEYTFKAAAMLHNMLLEWDGLDDFNWENTDPDGDVDEQEEDLPIHVDDEELFNNERTEHHVLRYNRK